MCPMHNHLTRIRGRNALLPLIAWTTFTTIITGTDRSNTLQAFFNHAFIEHVSRGCIFKAAHNLIKIWERAAWSLSSGIAAHEQACFIIKRKSTQMIEMPREIWPEVVAHDAVQGPADMV